MNFSDKIWLNLGKFYSQFGHSPYLKLLLVLIGVFVIILLLTLVRKHILTISMRGAVFGFFLGAVFVILLDIVFLAAVSDKQKLQNLFTGENRQEAFQEVVVSGVGNMTRVLGASTTVVSSKKPKTAQEVMVGILSLPKEETDKVRDLLCPR